MEMLTAIKDQGNKLFKENKFQEAIAKFQEAILQIKQTDNQENLSPLTQLGKLYVILLINSAFAALNCKNKNFYLQAQQWCTTALKIDPKNTKALYRRGLAFKEYGYLIEVESGVQNAELLELYEKAKNDFEDLILFDNQNQLGKKMHTQIVRDIYRVTKLQGKEVKLSKKSEHHKKQLSNTLVFSPQQTPKPKKLIDMAKIMDEYKLQEVVQRVRPKITQKYLQGPLPSTRSQLEKALRELRKQKKILLRFIYRLTSQCLFVLVPTFDTLSQIATILVEEGQGKQAAQSLLALRAQKNFGLFWKSMTKNEKDLLIQKWKGLGLPENELTDV